MTVRLPEARVRGIERATRELDRTLKARYPGRPVRWRKEDLHDLALKALLERSPEELAQAADAYLSELYSVFA